MPTADDVVSLLRSAIPAEPRSVTVDGILEGDPATEVTGIAVTTMATVAMLQQAAEAGANLLITHEPLFFSHDDGARQALVAADDPVYRTKLALVQESGVVVVHLHDQWHDVRPDPVDAATAAALGWTLDPEATTGAGTGTSTATIPETTLGELARHVADTLGAATLRYAGDPAARVTRVGLDLGFRGFARNRELLARPDVDVVLVGEAHEWETGEYAVDAVATGVAKGLVVVGHVPSEQSGMRAVAAWLPGVLAAAGHDLPVTYLTTPDTYRTP